MLRAAAFDAAIIRHCIEKVGGPSKAQGTLTRGLLTVYAGPHTAPFPALLAFVRSCSVSVWLAERPPLQVLYFSCSLRLSFPLLRFPYKRGLKLANLPHLARETLAARSSQLFVFTVRPDLKRLMKISLTSCDKQRATVVYRGVWCVVAAV